MDKNTILSISGDRDVPVRRESALRNRGFQVISASTESQARFEIEMGRWGIMLICFRTRADAIHELTNLFRRYCPVGTIVFVMNSGCDSVPRDVDYIVPDVAGPEAIVRALRSALPSAKAS